MTHIWSFGPYTDGKHVVMGAHVGPEPCPMLSDHVYRIDDIAGVLILTDLGPAEAGWAEGSRNQGVSLETLRRDGGHLVPKR